MIPPESDFIARAYPFYASKPDLTEQDYACLVKFFACTSQLNGWGLDKDELQSRLIREKPTRFCDVNSIIYESFLRKHGAKDLNWGIKAPVLIASMDKISDVFPDACFIHIVRDGRDVCLSYKSVHAMGEHFGPNGILTAAMFWVDGLRRIESFRESRNLLQVRYEDLLSSTESTLGVICSFLHILPVANFHASNGFENVVIPDQFKNTIHKKLGERLDIGNRERYRKEMTRFSLFCFELFAAPYLKKYDYELIFNALGYSVFGIIRQPFYLAARIYNNWRYRLRDSIAYRRTLQSMSQELI